MLISTLFGRPGTDKVVAAPACTSSISTSPQIRPIEEDVAAIMRARFDVLILTPGFELHGADMYGGNGFFAGVKPEARIGCIHDIMDVLAARDVKVIWSAVDKIKLYSGRHPHQLAFRYLVERLEDWLAYPEPKLGLIVADENKEVEQKLIDDLERYKAGNTGLGYRPTRIGSIVDSLHFVQSVNNKLIQCADLVAYFSLKYLRQEQAMIAEYIAETDPKAFWPTWREASLAKNMKKKAVYDIGKKLDLITVNRKLFP